MHPVREFRDEIDKYPGLLEICLEIEGLVSRRGIHSCGIAITNDPIEKRAGIMKAPNGRITTQFNLDELEALGIVKFDLLSVEILTKQRETLNLAIKYNKIKEMKTLRETYDSVLSIEKVDIESKKVWELINQNRINSLFQWDSPVGKQGVKAIHPENIVDLTVGNSLIRLMKPEGATETPMETYVRYKRNINEWYKDMREFGLSEQEMIPFKEYLMPKYGMAEAQEDLMILSMDKRICGLSVGEADALRKIIAKKKMNQISKFKEKVFKIASRNGASQVCTSYFWDVLAKRQLGYSFSVLHSSIYSFVAIQCAWLNIILDPVYWQTACLIVASGAAEEEHFFDNIEVKEKNTEYGKMATAISNFQNEGVFIKLPDINKSDYIFEPKEEEGAIYYGLKGIKKVNREIFDEIVLNRPYTSLKDFLEKVPTQKSIVYNLIKAGAFNEIENRSRREILYEYAGFTSNKIKKATLVQAKAIQELGLMPKRLEDPMKVYEFNRYIRQKQFKEIPEHYVLDERAISFYSQRFPIELIKNLSGISLIDRKAWEKIYKKETACISSWIKENSDEVTYALNYDRNEEEFDVKGSGTESEWEMDVLSFYYSGHELEGVDYDKYMLSNFFDLPVKRSPITSIVGTVLEKDKNKNTVTLLTLEGVVYVKMHMGRFAKYDKQVSEYDEKTGKKKIIEKSWFTKGSKLMVSGVRRGDNFYVKTKDKNMVPIYKITKFEKGELSLSASRDLEKISGEEGSC